MQQTRGARTAHDPPRAFRAPHRRGALAPPGPHDDRVRRTLPRMRREIPRRELVRIPRVGKRQAPFQEGVSARGRPGRGAGGRRGRTRGTEVARRQDPEKGDRRAGQDHQHRRLIPGRRFSGGFPTFESPLRRGFFVSGTQGGATEPAPEVSFSSEKFVAGATGRTFRPGITGPRLLACPTFRNFDFVFRYSRPGKRANKFAFAPGLCVSLHIQNTMPTKPWDSNTSKSSSGDSA